MTFRPDLPFGLGELEPACSPRAFRMNRHLALRLCRKASCADDMKERVASRDWPGGVLAGEWRVGKLKEVCGGGGSN